MADIDTTDSGSDNQPNEAEVAARAQGWVPKDEWTGEGKWRDAESFLDRGELFSKIDAQRHELKSLRKAQVDFAAHLETVRKTEFDRALASLRAEKKDALVDGDADAVIRVDEKIAEIREQARAVKVEQNQVANEPHPEFVAWANKNPWYTSSDAMRTYADVEGFKLAQRGVPPEQVLKEVEALVRKEFPQRFTNPNRERTSGVEGGTGKGAPTSGKESYQLSDEQRTVMNRLVKSGALTKEQYIADLKAADARGR